MLAAFSLQLEPDPYRWWMLAGVILSIGVWSRIARRDSRLPVIYFSALLGAFLGAKLVYLAAEGWMFWSSPDRWIIWATGKSILGALLGGYGAVEAAKYTMGYQSVTGDWFAGIVPIGVLLGRIGCLFHGCCLGTICSPALPGWFVLHDKSGFPRWPAVPVEMGFNLCAALLFWQWRRRRILPGQHFHFYLMAYGLFRFAHEFARETPRVVAGFSGYQVAALAVAALGAVRFITRQRMEKEGALSRIGKAPRFGRL